MPKRKFSLTRHYPPFIAAVVWLSLASMTVLRTLDDDLSHDFSGHVHYTQYIAEHKRIPPPEEYFESYQPPLYYLLNSLVFPTSLHHVRWVRFMSVVSGCIALWLIAWLLDHQGVAVSVQLIVLLFMATTPAYLFLFMGYNNDALSTLLGTSMIVLGYRLLHDWRRREAFFFS